MSKPVNSKIRQALLDGGRITQVYSHEGTPGGHNNDQVVLTMESGQQIYLDAYGMLEVRMARQGEDPYE